MPLRGTFRHENANPLLIRDAGRVPTGRGEGRVRSRIQTGKMRPSIGAAIALLLVFCAAPSKLAPESPPRDEKPAATPALPPEIEAQLKEVKTLAFAAPSKKAANPRLFSALLRLEEMLPRSAATRRAQERGKRAYLAMLSARSIKLAKKWVAIRGSVEQVMRRDPEYMNAVAAIDRRLASETGTPEGKRSPSDAGEARSIPLEQMRPGDIMVWDDRSGPPLVRTAISMFAWKATHTAIYLGETSTRSRGVQRWTLEAQSPALGVRVAVMDRKWIRRGLHVALGHVNGVTPVRAAQAAANAVATYGGDGRTPYHIWPPWDKTYLHEGVYCSQLVWSVYQQNGVDLDSNDWHYLAWFTIHNWFNPYAAPTAYFAVFPDEIKASPHISWYYDQVNP